MKRILKIFIPIAIFFVTLWLLLFLWTTFLPGGNETGMKHDWEEVVPGNPHKLPKMAEIHADPGTVFRHRFTNKYGLVADNYFRLNSFGIRDDIDVDRPKKTHLLFAGCSFTYGDNIPLEDTFPAILRTKLPDRNVRSLSFPGGGLHTALRHFEVSDFREFVPEKKGIYAYVFIFDHYSRFSRDVGLLRWARPKTPTYDSINGKVSYAGFLEGHPEYKRYHFLKSLGIALANRGPLVIEKKPVKEKMDAFMDGIVRLKEMYLEKFPDGRFVWIIHPQSRLTPLAAKVVRNAADKRGIEIVIPHEDYHQFLKSRNLTIQDHVVKWDGHPNGKFNKWFSEWLMEHLLSERTIKR